MTNILAKFCVGLGMKINMEKSKTFSSKGVLLKRRNKIAFIPKSGLLIIWGGIWAIIWFMGELQCVTFFILKRKFKGDWLLGREGCLIRLEG